MRLRSRRIRKLRDGSPIFGVTVFIRASCGSRRGSPGAEKLSRISDDENWSPKTAEEMSP